MREHYGREPDIDRKSLVIWMPVSLIVAGLLIWLGLSLPPVGISSSVQGIPASPEIGAMGFTYLLTWAAFAYGVSISTPHNTMTRGLLVLSLISPIVAVLALSYGMIIVALLLAIAWLALLITAALRLAKQEPLAGLMFLPLIGSAVASVLLPLTYWFIG
ncbi:hypothetical protein [Halothiobacillus sp.]|uniref:hypothetical protein n=1 Tax=Halothiobacillus sp. TaxID=1891311 RepID=UPI0026162C27|nr:hypothetical protein [Halothiobacillus sp.]MDD4967187.1 hypothetical protein [Halothiobacillus sp.]